jgi:hypothetical protein
MSDKGISGKPLIEVLTDFRSDATLLDWIEAAGAQVWRDKRHKNWTCQVIVAGQVIQPTRATLRAAIIDAMTEHAKFIT